MRDTFAAKSRSYRSLTFLREKFYPLPVDVKRIFMPALKCFNSAASKIVLCLE
jgi:hypothetical protein